MDLESLAVDLCGCSRPWSHPPDQIQDTAGGRVPVDLPHLLFQHRSIAAERVILFFRRELSFLEQIEGLGHGLSAQHGKPVVKRRGGLFGGNRDLFFQKHVAGIEPDIHHHGSDAGFCFAVDDAPVNRRCTAVFREKRGVNIDASETGYVKEGFREDLSEGYDDDKVGTAGTYLFNRFRSPDFLRLQDRYPVLFCKHFDRRLLHLLTAAFRTVRLGDCGNDVLAAVDQHLEGRAGELWCPHEDNTEGGHQSFPSCSRFLRYFRRKMSLLSCEMWSMKRMPSRWSISCWKAMARSPSAFQVISSPSISSPLTTIFACRRTFAAYLGTERHPSSSKVSPSACIMTGLIAV